MPNVKKNGGCSAGTITGTGTAKRARPKVGNGTGSRERPKVGNGKSTQPSVGSGKRRGKRKKPR